MRLQSSSCGRGLKVIQPFGARTKERGTIAENTRLLTEIFPWTEAGCVLSFETLEEVEQHVDSGKHVRELESESCMIASEKSGPRGLSELM